MYSPLTVSAYVSMWLGANLSKPIIIEKPYKSYTTTRLMTNKDMYNVREVLEEILIKEIKQEENK
jgi:hypothetical protein